MEQPSLASLVLSWSLAVLPVVTMVGAVAAGSNW